MEVIHNASVMGAVASCGLQLYNFGQTVSIPLWEGNWEPDSFYEKIKVNKVVRYSTSILWRWYKRPRGKPFFASFVNTVNRVLQFFECPFNAVRSFRGSFEFVMNGGS